MWSRVNRPPCSRPVLSRAQKLKELDPLAEAAPHHGRALDHLPHDFGDLPNLLRLGGEWRESEAECENDPSPIRSMGTPVRMAGRESSRTPGRNSSRNTLITASRSLSSKAGAPPTTRRARSTVAPRRSTATTEYSAKFTARSAMGKDAVHSEI